MSRKLIVAIFLIVTLMMISWLGNAVAAERERGNRDAQIRQLRGRIKELKAALERDQSEGNIKEFRQALKQSNQRLERLMAGGRETRERRDEFPEIQMAIRKARGALRELRQGAKNLQEEGGKPDKLEATRKQIARKEGELKELNALLEKRRADKKKRQDGETQIRRLRGQIQELKYALGHHRDSEKVGAWKKSLKESEGKLERLMAAGRQTQRRRRPRGKLIAGRVVSGTEEDVTIKTLEAGKVMVLRVPMRRREDGTRVKRTDLARVTGSLQKERLVLARYNEGEEPGAYFLQQIKDISFSSGERSERARPRAKKETLESLIARIDRTLKKLERERSQTRRSRGER